MRIDEIEIYNFRNIEKGILQLGANVNVVNGENAQGKTNLLEAIYMTAGGRSFRTRFDNEIIGFSQNITSIEAAFNAAERNQKLQIHLIRGQKKKISLNGVNTVAAKLQGVLTAVLFCPEDLRLVTDGAVVRRRFLDMAISQLRPGYAAALNSMNQYHEQKIRILRDMRENPSLFKVFDEFTDGLLKTSASVIRYRAAFIDRLCGEAARIHLDFSGEREILGMEYKTCSAVTEPKASASEIYAQLLEHAARHRDAEISSGRCLTGAHRDDLVILIDGISAREYASQGQTRTAALSLKLAEREIFMQDTGEYPVLLLDDVLSELDAARREFVLRRITGGQTVITCCDGGESLGKTNGRIFTVENGKITLFRE